MALRDRFLKNTGNRAKPSKAALHHGVTAGGARRGVSGQKVAAASSLDALREEIDLLTSYASDTVYRLNYETMIYDYISPTISKLLGFSPEEMKKLEFRSLIVQTRLVTDGLKTVESYGALEGRRQAGDVSKWQADYLINTKDGRQIWVSDVSLPWFDEKGTIIGSVGSLRDVTDRVEAEEQIREQLKQANHVDALTGLSNRQAFFDDLEKELLRLNRNDSEMALLLIDADHLQRVVDEHGLDAGNDVLQEVGQVIQRHLRATDLPARLGGESFAVMLPDTSTEGAYNVAKRIHDSVLRNVFRVGADNVPMSLTVSIGVATATSVEPISASELFKLADTRMYIAKNTGGDNRVCIDPVQQTH